MVKNKTRVKFASKLSILSKERIQPKEKNDSSINQKQYMIDDCEPEEEEPYIGNNNYPPIRIEYTTKKDSINLDRCSVTPKPPRENVPIFLKRGNDSRTSGYTFKTNFIGHTKIISVTPSERQEYFEQNNNLILRNPLVDGISIDMRDTNLKKLKINNKNMGTILEDSRESLDGGEHSLKKRNMNENSLSSDKRLLTSEPIRGVIKDISELQNKTKNEAVAMSTYDSKRDLNNLSKHFQNDNIHSDYVSTLMGVETTVKNEDSLKQILIQPMRNVTPPNDSPVFRPLPSNKRQHQTIMPESKVKSSNGDKFHLFGEQEDRISNEIIEHQMQDRKTFHNKLFNTLKFSSAFPTIRKPQVHEINTIPLKEDSPVSLNKITESRKELEESFYMSPKKHNDSENQNGDEGSILSNNEQSYSPKLFPRFSTISEKHRYEVNTKSSKAENSISVHKRNRTGPESKVLQELKESEIMNGSKLPVSSKKDLNNFDKRLDFYTEDYLLADGNKFSKQPFNLSLQMIGGNKNKTNYKVLTKKDQTSVKNDYNTNMSKLKFAQGLQKLPQIASSESTRVKLDGRAPHFDLMIEKGNTLNQSAKSSEVYGQLKLPDLRKSLSRLIISQPKKKSKVMSHSEFSDSTSKFDEFPINEKNVKSKQGKILSFHTDLSKSNNIKELFLSSHEKLQKPEKSESFEKNQLIGSITKMSNSSTSYLPLNVSDSTNEAIKPLTQNIEMDNTESKSEHEFGEKTTSLLTGKSEKKNEFEFIEELVQYNSEDSIERVLEDNELYNDSNKSLYGEEIEMEISSVQYGEELYTEGKSKLSSSNFSNVVFEQKSNSPISLLLLGEDEQMSALNEVPSSSSTDSSDFSMKINSESIQNMVREYLMSNLRDDVEEMEEVKKRELAQEFDYNYRGTYDVNQLRTGFGYLHWDALESRTYCGYFLYNSLHGKGHYFIKEEKCLNFYNGHFYGNKLYGYGQIVHDNGDKFEGLFKDNTRFGPGVYTHPNGTQDVGIWYGYNLLRLSTDLSRYFPSFSKSKFGKVKLQQFKKVVRLKIPHKEKAQDILENLNADKNILDKYKNLYNPHVRNENSLFFDKSEYDDVYFRNEDCYIDISRSWKSHKTTPNMDVIKNIGETEDKSEERVELVKTIERVETKLMSFRKQIEELQKNQEFDHTGFRDITSPAHFPNEKEKNKLYKEELFYRSVLDFLKYKLNRYEQGSYTATPIIAQKLRVDSLLAWNNNKIFVDILLHTFRCRNSEENIRFEVKPIVIGEREHFGQPGEHEESCKFFLDNCRFGDDYNALKLLVKQNINPDLCDLRGNTGLHFGTCFDHVNIIKLLANNGANLDITNDEGLTPINLALLRYLEIIYDVHNWEFAFLSKPEVSLSEKEQFSEWIPFDSFFISLPKTTLGNRRSSCLSTSMSANDVAVNRKSRKSKKSNVSSKSSPGSFLKLKTAKLFKELIPDLRDRFLFSLEYNRKKLWLASETVLNSNATETTQKIVSGLNVENILHSKEDEKKLLRITETLGTLLQYGVDPNIDAVPFPPFFISLFTKSSQIVEFFLRNTANPNQFYHGMTPLQIICCLEPCYELCQIMTTMIQYFADVNLLSDPLAWRECDKDLCQDYPIDSKDDSHGKNALHFICLREDFSDLDNVYLCRMAEILLEANTKTSILYLGHSHLSIAVLKGNVDLIKCLSKFVDIRRTLGFGLGNALTVLALRRYPYVIPFHICKEIIDCLLDLGISPFEPLYNHKNIFEFLDTDSPPLLDNNTRAWNAFVTHIKRYRSFINQTPDTPIHTNCNIISKIYIQEKSRSILNLFIRFRAVLSLYSFFRETILNKYTTYLAKLIGSSHEALINLEVIFRCGKLPVSYFSNEIALKLLEYVDEENRNPKNNEMEPHIQLAAERIKCKYILNNPELKRISEWVSGGNLLRCNVCYFCMHKEDKVLLSCPLCGIVMFCSKQCNYLSMKFKTIHTCRTLFYHDIFKENQIFIKNNESIPLYGIDLVYENAISRNQSTSSVQCF